MIPVRLGVLWEVQVHLASLSRNLSAEIIEQTVDLVAVVAARSLMKDTHLVVRVPDCHTSAQEGKAGSICA